ncbi:hypothetical protein DAPPUDRAFT_259426 [Daphnia pulex]|uniref:HAT C-terminal dimerisation domain-containing protein n=1 Tax=Daphnia pulex TaxID=6669 RepID=E9HH80_DAPPU|nr:hypothetical protein DAPPUDRAFT_259426 [Daphnia pulex]|eukprot:EFX68895.1 hypothetical protein DAPPUDRAFT_259426 [Daphnia pulex]
MSAIFEFWDSRNFAFFQVGKEFTNQVDLERPNWIASDHFPVVFYALRSPPCYRDAVINATVHSEYWKLNNYRFPALAPIAEDITRIPYSSLNIELAFSRAVDILSANRI